MSVRSQIGRGAEPEPAAAAASGLARILRPQSVAIVGASQRPGSIGAAIVENLQNAGFTGALYPVNPNNERIGELRCYPSLQAIGAAVDLAVVAVPAAAVEAAVQDAAAARVGGLVIISSGFAEASPEGRARERRITAIARSAGVRLVGPNCVGVINTDPAVRLHATFTPQWPAAGNIGILSQSGALGVVILNHARSLNLGVSSFVSVGNKADVSGNDLLEYWRDDPATRVIALYLESFGNPRKFARLAPEVVRRKPIVAIKSGRSAAGKRAASSHSAALASLDVAVDALFEQAGVIRTQTFEDLFDVVSLLSTQPLPAGPRVGVVTNAGGPGILLADACEAQGLKLPVLAAETISKLGRLLPPHAGLANPIDLVGTDSAEVFERAMEVVGNDPSVDSLVVIFITPLPTSQPERVAAGIARGAGLVPAHKPVLCVFLASKGAPDVLRSGPRGPLPSYVYPENAALALAAAHRYHCWREQPVGRRFRFDDAAAAAIRAIIDRAVRDALPSRWLTTPELNDLLAAAGVRTVASRACLPAEAAPAAATLGYPLVAKAIAPGLLHKSDAGGVILGLEDERDVHEAVETLSSRMQRAGHILEGVLLQRQESRGIEAMVGVTTDPTFGPLVVCGIGGVQVELMKDAAFRLTPVSDAEAGEMIDSLRMAPLLAGYRGAPPGDRPALIELIQRISALTELAPEIREMDLNPVKVLPPGEGVVVLDGRVRIGPAATASAMR